MDLESEKKDVNGSGMNELRIQFEKELEVTFKIVNTQKIVQLSLLTYTLHNVY